MRVKYYQIRSSEVTTRNKVPAFSVGFELEILVGFPVIYPNYNFYIRFYIALYNAFFVCYGFIVYLCSLWWSKQFRFFWKEF